MRQSSSDPLPYVQVDRAVKPRAAMLADAIGVSRQHAMGSLIEWWDLCGDPRELERIVEDANRTGQEPAVILTPEDAALRFRLASTREVEPITLARIGLLEELDGGKRFRVRGMSRYFDPVIRRVQAREAARVGGKASAETRKKAHGSAQPTGGKGSVVGSDVAQAATEAPSEAEPKRNGSDNRSGTEAEPKPSGQRSAVSGQRSPQSEEAPTPPDLPIATFHVEQPDLSNVEAWTKEEFWRAAECTRRELGFPPQRWPSPVALSRWWGEARAMADVAELGAAFEDYARSKYAAEKKPPAPFEVFMKSWNSHLPSRRSS